MYYLESINSLLSGSVLPAVLIFTGIYLGARQRFYCILHPVRFIKDLKAAGTGGGTSPFKALSTALAGTLGVGNISGVATAVSAGGAGAVFWMWISALCAMSVKYAEVYLAVLYRKENGGKKKGGAPYYIKEGLSKYFGKRRAAALALFFAFLLVTNSLLTGNLVQVNAAVSAGGEIPPWAVALAFGICTLVVVGGGASRVGDFTVKTIPVLSAVYIALSLFIIFSNFQLVPGVFREIFRGAFRLPAAVGGICGYGMKEAVRYGVTRGVFSNEAGCGTAPTAHAAADTKSPHHQGCFGIFEAFCDTIVLCTMTAVIILMADVKGCDGIALSVKSYGFFGGGAAQIIIAASVIIFALATVICQAYYGIEALSFISGGKRLKYLYLACSFAVTIAGAYIAPAVMWQIADLQIAVMTIINTLVVFILSDEVKTKKL